MITRRNISYSVTHRFVWYRVAKTGTRTLHKLLESHIDDYRYLAANRDRPTVELIKLLDHKETFRFTIVRNPWGRLCSAWANKINTPRPVREQMLRALGVNKEQMDIATSDFGAFVKMLPNSRLFEQNAHFKPQAEILAGAQIEHVARFENYLNEVREILLRVGISDKVTEIPKRNSTSVVRRNLCDWYDTTTRQIVAELYAKDIERWNYQFSS